MIEPTLKQLKYLKALHSEQSFSKAAQSCFVTQSTLSAAIKELEDHLEAQLVDRSHKQIKLTTIGLETLRASEDIFEHIRILENKIQKASKPFSGPIRIGILPTIAPYLMPELLPLFDQHYPDLEPSIYEDMSHNLMEQLERDKLDMLILAFPYKTPHLEQAPLIQEDFIAIVPKTTQAPSKLSIKDLKQHKILLLAEGHCMRRHILEACQIDENEQLSRHDRVLHATSLSTLVEMVNHNYGISLLPEMAFKNMQMPKGVKRLSFKNPKPKRTIGLAWNPKNPKHDEYKILSKNLKTLLN